MTHDAVLLDFDGTLVELPDRERLRGAVRRACRRAGIEDAVRETIDALRAGDADRLVEQCRAASVDLDSFRAAAAGEVIGAQLRAVEAGLRTPYRDVAALRAIDKPLGIVSNNHPRALRSLLDRFGIADQFAVVRGCRFTPDGIDRRKPAPDNVLDAMDELGATDPLCVGDRPLDVAAAHNAGVTAALIDRSGSPDGDRALDSEPSPVHHLSSLAELAEIV